MLQDNARWKGRLVRIEQEPMHQQEIKSVKVTRVQQIPWQNFQLTTVSNHQQLDLKVEWRVSRRHIIPSLLPGTNAG